MVSIPIIFMNATCKDNSSFNKFEKYSIVYHLLPIIISTTLLPMKYHITIALILQGINWFSQKNLIKLDNGLIYMIIEIFNDAYLYTILIYDSTNCHQCY